MHSNPVIALREQMEPRMMASIGGVFQRASWDQCRLLGAWMGLALYGALGRRRNIAISNVRLALGVSVARANQLTRQSCMNFGMTFAEFMHLKDASPDDVRQTSYIQGLENVQAGFDAGKGVILLTAHLGNWELMGARAALEFPLSVVARPTSNVGVQAHIDASRTASGIQVISKYDTGRSSLNVLKSNGALAILPDQYAGAEGMLLPMFGQPTRVWGAVARLGLMTGAQIVPAFGVRKRPWIRDGRIIATVKPGWTVERGENREQSLEDGTKRMIAELETIIRQHPDQWLWLHRRWRPVDGAVIPQMPQK